MKKIIITLFVLLLLPTISAASIDMKSEFKQDETLLATIYGNFIDPLEEENILLYQEHIRIPLDVELTKIQDKYYLYAQLLDKEQGDYSLKLEGIKYIKINTVLEEDIIKNFTITNETADFSVEPGLIVTETGFSIKVQNLLDQEITVKIKENETIEEPDEVSGFFDALFGSEEEVVLNEERTKSVSAWGSETLDFNITNISETELRTITLYTDNIEYNIPIYVIISEATIPGTGERSFIFSPPTIDLTMATDSEATRIVYLYNDGEETLTDIDFIISDSIKPFVELSVEYISELEENESIQITLYFYSDNEEKAIEGDIRANSSDLYAYLGIITEFIPDYIPDDGEENPEVFDPVTNPTSSKKCEDLDGIICAQNETCSEDTTQARDGNCCFAECEEVELGNPKAKIIGWTIIIVLALAVVWFYMKKFKKK